jgi:chorismate lyase/3-hydroxybenzoate synthase
MNLSMATTAQESTPMHATIVPDWSAVGCHERDLSSWLGQLDSDFGAGRVHVASRTIGADALRGEAITEAARQAFHEALLELPGGPCRVWSFLPRPTERDDDLLERYMRFNAGRTQAYRQLADRVRVVPAGTCVGHAGSDLVVHALWIDAPFAAVENPRQRPAWLYSDRYGPVPPAFTRAVRIGGMLLASGTASVVGEDSVHHGQLDEQFRESVRNLESLAEAGGGDGRWRSLQIYVRDTADLARLGELARTHFGDAAERILHAPICRRELLVEIEGVCSAS